MTTDISNAALWDENKAAKYLGLTPRTMQQWRWSGSGTRYVRVSGRCIRYRPEDLDAFVQTRIVSSTADPGKDALDQ